jgi:hypothetical protein
MASMKKSFLEPKPVNHYHIHPMASKKKGSIEGKSVNHYHIRPMEGIKKGSIDLHLTYLIYHIEG